LRRGLRVGCSRAVAFRSLATLTARSRGPDGIAQAIKYYDQAWNTLTNQASTLAMALAIETCNFLTENVLWNNLAMFLKQLPPAILARDWIRIAQANVALYVNRDARSVLQILEQTEFPTIPSEHYGKGTTWLVNLWYNAFYMLEEAQVGRSLTDIEKVHVRRSHPPPDKLACC